MVLSIFLFIAALVLLAFSVIFILPYEGIYQALSTCFFTFSVLIITRYLLKGFVYDVKESSEGYDLSVTEVRGKSSITVCRVSLSNIEAIETLKINEKEKKRSLRKKAVKEGRKTFSYFPDMLPQNECLVFVTECGEPYLLKLAADETLINILVNAQKDNETRKKAETEV
jgi:hypothetical protein